MRSFEYLFDEFKINSQTSNPLKAKQLSSQDKIKLYRNKPEIILNSPNQIKEINQ